MPRSARRRTPAVAIAATVLAAALSSSAPPLATAQAKKLTLERLQAEPPLAGSLPTGLAWHPDARRLTYLRQRSSGQDLVAFDTDSGREVTLLAAEGVKHPATGKPLPLAGYSWSSDGGRLLVAAEGDLFVVDAKSGAARALTRTPETEELAELSPDGRRAAFVRKNDLYVVDVSSGRETRLTKTGSETVLNGRLDWVYEEELAGRSAKGFEWSPSSDAVAYLQLDQARVPTFPIVDFLPVHNEVKTQRYPKAGDPNAVVRVGVVGLAKDGTAGPERLTSFTPDDVYVVPDLAFTPDGRALAYLLLNRAQNELQLRLLPVPESAAAALGAARTVLTERSDTWLNAPPAPAFLKDGRGFLWLSERTGFAHLYLCETTGSCRPVTQGAWMVDAQPSFAGGGGPLLLEERSGFVYFVATEKDPRERHLYRARLDGTGRARLTRDEGTHRVLLAPDAKHFADTRSTVELPPALAVSRTDGTRTVAVAYEKTPEVSSFERGAYEWIELKAADGAVLYGRLLKPAGFDAAKRYPVIFRVYGGPGVQAFRNGWDQSAPFDQLLAGHGFLVFSLDNRGTQGRGHAFESPIFHAMGRAELEDQLMAVAHLKTLPYADTGRLGIFGWSYGGYLTLYALTHAPDVFKAGVAGAPVTDWNFYDSIYTERYMGQPKDNPKGYEASSPLKKAGDLKAELLLIQGTDDDNVHLANTVAFVDALIRAGHSYSLLLHPRQMHGFGAQENRLHRDAAILRHFETTLRP